MFSGGKYARAALAAAALAVMIGVAGCGSSGGGGGGGALSGSNAPSWAGKLGSGVSVEAPGTASPGNGSPQAVMAGVVAALTGGHFSDICKYYQPSEQSKCQSDVGAVTPAEAAAAGLPTFKNFAIGYTAIKGDEALVGTTGSVCDTNNTPQCYTNNDPAAILDSGQPFDSLWTQAGSASSSSYSLAQCIQVNGSWYADTSAP